MKLFLSLLLIFVSFGAPDYSKTASDFSQNQDEPFLLAIEDVFSITGRGTVVTGKIERGTIKVGDRVDIVGLDQNMETEVTGIEMFRKLLDAAEAGDNVGMILKGVTKEDVRRGMVLAKPGSIKAYNEFEGEIVMLKKEEGGRHTPAFNRYKPQFYIRTADITGEISLLNDVQMLMPGDTALISVKLISSIGLEEGLKFAIREAGKTVGAGVVKKLLP